MGKIITDNLAFVRTVELMGTRDNAKTIDLSDVLPEEVEEKVRFESCWFTSQGNLHDDFASTYVSDESTLRHATD